MKYILVGAPGSGKAIIADHLSHQFGIPHVSYRNIVQELLRKKRISDKLRKDFIEFKPFDPKQAFDLLVNYTEKLHLVNFVLEGYPKTGNEALLLANYLKNDNGPKTTFFINVESGILEE